jgi:hypothetical protein
MLSTIYSALSRTRHYGVYLYLVLVWLSVIVIAWIFGGGLRRKIWHQPGITVGIGIVIQPPAMQLTPIIFYDHDSDCIK